MNLLVDRNILRWMMNLNQADYEIESKIFFNMMNKKLREEIFFNMDDQADYELTC